MRTPTHLIRSRHIIGAPEQPRCNLISLVYSEEEARERCESRRRNYPNYTVEVYELKNVTEDFSEEDSE